MASRSPVGSSTAARGWARPIAGDISSPTTRAASGRSRSRSTAPERRRASDRREHTAELGGSTVLGIISSFGVDADGELYIVNHSGGRIVRITAPLTAPPAPTGLKIVKP